MPQQLTPAQAWQSLYEGNERFARGEMKHPSQGVEHRTALKVRQTPFAVVLGCSDSRVASEIVFDRGLGDLFVVRTAGHVVDTSVLGSVEYGVQALGASLVVVLGHDSCGAVAAAVKALETGETPTGFVRAVVDRVLPSVVLLPDEGGTLPAAGSRSLVPSVENLVHGHVRHTVRLLESYSALLRDGIEAGRVAIVGARYTLKDGKIGVVEVRGDIG